MATSGFAWMQILVVVLACHIGRPIHVNAAVRGPQPDLKRGINGGMSCAACTILVSLAEQVAEVNNGTVTEVLETICLHIPEKYQYYCRLAFDVLGPTIIEMLAEGANADVVCQALNLCHTDTNEQQCMLYSRTKHLQILHKQSVEVQRQKFNLRLQKFGVQGSRGINICDIPGISILCHAYNETFSQHMPGQDADQDRFSVIEGLRGSSWRGKDCDDVRPDVHPGKIPVDSDIYHDSNCNGIFGQEPGTSASYESEWCQNSGQQGVIAIGDSVGAHFHAPEEWFNAVLFSPAALKDIAFIVSNELDWPQLSSVTGYMNTTWPVVRGLTDSVYLKMRERNRCNHRDYQNIAVNGDDSFEVLGFVKSLSRDQMGDTPALVFVELVGNDICNNNPDTVAHMTTPQQMSDNMMTLLHELDAKLPNGSHILLAGLADGDFLYQFLHNRTHPLGAFRQDLTYEEVYDWWNCLLVTPCYGWLNSNETLRKQTTQRGNELSDVMKAIAIKYRYGFKNFEVNFVDNPITPILQQWLKDHGNDSGWQLIEPVDGFHPNQVANFLTAQYIWQYLEENLPHYIGKQNPNNERIITKFGDQGGH